jgi:hypothetical protein
MFERYTDKARRVIFFARYEASQYGSPQIETEHLLLGLLREDKALGTRLFSEHGSADKFRQEVEQRWKGREKTATSVDLPLSPESKSVLRYAVEESERLAAEHIGCEHLVLGMLREQNCFAAEALQRAGISLEQWRQEIPKLTPPPIAPEESTEQKAAEQTASKTAQRLRDILGSAGHYRAQGALWGAGYVRKCQSLVEGEFHWERRLIKPRDALVSRDSKAIMLHSGEVYDTQAFELLPGGWKHDHCVVCWKTLYKAKRPEESLAFTNGSVWLCPECYEAFLGGEQ